MYRKRLPDDLCERGVFLDSLGIWEYAWKYEDIIKDKEYIEKNDMFILGGDVYRITENSIEALGDNWYIESVRNIKPKDSIDETMKYINDYYVKNGNQYIYSLVIQS